MGWAADMDAKLRAILARLEAEDAGNTYNIPDDPAWKEQAAGMRSQAMPTEDVWARMAGTGGGMMAEMPESRGRDLGIVAQAPPLPQGRMAGGSSDAELMRLLQQMGIQ